MRIYEHLPELRLIQQRKHKALLALLSVGTRTKVPLRYFC